MPVNSSAVLKTALSKSYRPMNTVFEVPGAFGSGNVGSGGSESWPVTGRTLSGTLVDVFHACGPTNQAAVAVAIARQQIAAPKIRNAVRT